MKTLSEFQNEKLRIVQPSLFKRTFELRSENELLSTLSYPKFFSRNAIVEGNLTGNFEFYFPNFWKSQVEVRPIGNELAIAKYYNKIFSLSEVIELQRGERVILKSFAFRNRKEIQSETGETLIVFNFGVSVKFRVSLEIAKKSDLIDKYPWLIMLVVYLSDQHKKSKS